SGSRTKVKTAAPNRAVGPRSAPTNETTAGRPAARATAGATTTAYAAAQQRRAGPQDDHKSRPGRGPKTPTPLAHLGGPRIAPDPPRPAGGLPPNPPPPEPTRRSTRSRQESLRGQHTINGKGQPHPDNHDTDEHLHDHRHHHDLRTTTGERTERPEPGKE